MKILKIIFITLSSIWILISSIITLLLTLLLIPITIWFKNKLFLHSVLFVTATTMSIGLIPIGFLYKIIKTLIISKTKAKELSKYFRKVAITDDQKGNVVLGALFNDILITKNGYKYGNEDETISSATGKNVIKGTLSTFGKKVNLILELFSEKHSVTSIEEDEGVNSSEGPIDGGDIVKPKKK